jgi:prepilin-type N-terminal cleavage/methylation domain-containing protein
MTASLFHHRLAHRMLTRKRAMLTANQSGFTLVELLVVVVIIGALAAIGWPAYVNQLSRSNYNAAAIDALSKAKECVAAVAAGDQTGTCNPTYTATAGQGTYAKTVTVTVGANGAITPAPAYTP